MKVFPSGRQAWLRFALTWLFVVLLVGGFVMYMTAMPGHSFAGTLPPLSAEETQIRANLTQHVNYLAGTIGERNIIAYDSLLKTAQYIEDDLKKLGYEVTPKNMSCKCGRSATSSWKFLAAREPKRSL